MYRKDQLLKEDDTIQYGDKLKVTQKNMQPFIFQDVFRHVDLELPKVSNSRFILIKNNKETGFHEQIHPGDDLRIMWPTAGSKIQ